MAKVNRLQAADAGTEDPTTDVTIFDTDDLAGAAVAIAVCTWPGMVIPTEITS